MSIKPKIIVIIQARFGSSRLPGKILKMLGPKPILSHVIERAKSIKAVSKVIVAVPDLPESAPIIKLAADNDAMAVSGSENDVLSRYHKAFSEEEKQSGQPADHIIRITSDCPLLCPEVCDQLIEDYLESGSDYGGIGNFPHGLDVEIFTNNLLVDSHNNATNSHDREHVTLWMKKLSAIKKTVVMADQNYHADHRWVLDYPEDFEFFTKLHNSMGDALFKSSWLDIVTFIKSNSSLQLINKDVAKEWANKTAEIYKQSQSS